jgi:hypothetical protein
MYFRFKQCTIPKHYGKEYPTKKKRKKKTHPSDVELSNTNLKQQ